jgi:hypothetical protein
MRAKNMPISFFLLFLIIFPLEKRIKPVPRIVQINTVAARTSFATGYCSGVNLGITILDTANYQPSTLEPLPAEVNLDMPTPGDQGSQGSCAAWATVYGAANFYIHNATGRPYSDTGNLSPKFIYNQISRGNCTCTSVLDNLYLLQSLGACSMRTMPYDPNDCSTQPDSLQLDMAGSNKIKGWKKVNVRDLNLIKRALSEKRPVIFAITTDDGFKKIAAPYIWQSRTGKIGEAHSMVITGYDDIKKTLKVMNSWSNTWGDNGFVYIDYQFFLDNVLEGGHIII